MAFIHLQVKGSHYQCGQQIGQALKPHIKKEINSYIGSHRKNWPRLRQQVLPYLHATQSAFPWIIQELRGASDGARIDFLDLFIASVDELLESSPTPVRACTDLVILPEKSQGDILIGHNNDLDPATKAPVTLTEWQLTNQSKLFTIGIIGLFLGAGINSQGIILSGNELTSNDYQIGIPRLWVARAVLSARNFDQAVTIATVKQRASSYNNIIIGPHRQIINLEGSALDWRSIPPQAGILAHTNHYLHPQMKKYEARSQEQIINSKTRHQTVKKLTRQIKPPLTEKDLKTILSDHTHQANAICRHQPDISTVFSLIINATQGWFQICPGQPCCAKWSKKIKYLKL